MGLLALLLPALAGAQSVSDLHFEDDGATLTDTDLAEMMNVAGCKCSRSVQISFGFTRAGTEGGLYVVSGRGCLDSDATIKSTCTTLARLRLESADPTVDVSTNVATVLGGCDEDEGDDTLYVLADVDDQDTWTELASVAFPRDTKPPTKPTGGKVVAGEELAEVAYTIDTDADTTGVRYQVLCSVNEAPVFSSPAEEIFTSAEDLCGAAGDVKAAYVCGKAQSGADSVTVSGLTNGVSYAFWVVSVDAAGNPSDPVSLGTAVPAEEEDLFERYKAAGGSADGGNCFIATAAYGDYGHPQVRVLRAFRDQVLAPTAAGRWFVDTYYALSPGAARIIADSPVLRAATRVALYPVVWLAGHAIEEPTP
ncbi:MAG: hypothetical protein H6730_30965 [Deltaproteobacteria bacterium]|nr:hypothetical protein [Deltaproteobacteria bacterium]